MCSINFQDTHGLIKFLDENSTAIVPVNLIQKKETLEYGGTCGVVWSYKKVYNGFLICSGIYYIYVLCVYVIIPQRSGRLKRNCVGFCNLNLIVV